MPNHPTNTGTGPWRILILDRDREDPKWIVATVGAPGDVRPARRGETEPDDVNAAWASRNGRNAVLLPMRGALAWRIDG
jgi:hypothetical protein